MTDSSLTDILLWAVLPYVMVGIFVTGVAWRYRYDQFGWTTRSSELYESRLLRIGSPLFHFGLVFVVAGHVLGLIIPDEWTAALGVTETRYHYVASSSAASPASAPSWGSRSCCTADAPRARCSWPPPATTR